MTKLLPTLVALLLAATLTGQVTLTSDYFPVAGDTLRYSRAADIAVEAFLELDGADQVWNFGQRDQRIPITRPVVATDLTDPFPEADVKVLVGANSAEYYTLSDTAFTLVGVLSGNDIFPEFVVAAEVDPNRAVRRAPLRYEATFASETNNQVTISPDSLPEDVLETLPDQVTLADSIRLTTISTRRDTVDAYGTVLLNGQSYEVLREKSVESIETTIEVRSILGYTDVTGLLQTALPDSLARFLGPQPGLVTYTYWNQDNKEYIARAETLAETGEVIEFTIKRAEQTNSTSGPFTTQARITVYPNPARSTATFEIDGLQQGRYELLLVNMLGRQVASRQFYPEGNPTRIGLDVSQLPRGIYLYSLRNERGRTMATKRLLVSGG